MQVFAAEFPISPNRTTLDVLDVGREWLSGSPHYPWTDSAVLRHNGDEIIEHRLDGHIATLACAGDVDIIGLKHSYVEGELEWTTELVSNATVEGPWVSITVYCNALRKGVRIPTAKRPYLVRLLLSKLGGGCDGQWTVQDKAVYLDDGQISTAADLVNGVAVSQLPVLYVSCNFDERPAVDFVRMAKDFAGAAHVLVEPSRRFSRGLAKATASENVYGGAVAIYWPGAAGVYRFLPRAFDTRHKMSDAIDLALREGWLSAKPQKARSWASLTQAISRRQIEKLRESGSSELEEYVRRFDEENSSLRAQLLEAQATISSLRARHQPLKAKSGEGPISWGNEQEIFDGEISDIVISALSAAARDARPAARKATVLADLLKANPPVGRGDEIEKEIRDILSNAMNIGVAEVSALGKLGFEVETGGKHYKATFGGDSRLSFTLHKTASDHRAPKNLVSQIVGKLFG